MPFSVPYYVFEARGLDLFYVLVRFRIAFGTSYNRFDFVLNWFVLGCVPV